MKSWIAACRRPFGKPSAIVCAGLCLILLLLSDISAESRTWNSKAGTQVEAEYVRQTETQVVLKRADGIVLTVDKQQFSDADRKHLDDLKQAEQAQNAPKVAPPGPAKRPSTPKKQPAKPKPSDSTKSDSQKSQTPKNPSQKNDPKKLTTPVKKFPFAQNPLTQKPIPDEPGTDYAALARELVAPPQPAKFVEKKTFAMKLNAPDTACLAEMGHFLLDHDDKKDELQVWDLDAGKITATVKCGALANSRCFAISPSGKYVGCGTPEQAAKIFEVSTGKLVKQHLVDPGKKKTLLRIAFNWDDDEFVLLNDAAELDRVLIHGPDAERHNFQAEIPEPAAAWTNDPDGVRLTVSGQGRIAARLTDRYTYSCYVEQRTLGFNAQAHRTYQAIPVRNGIVYWSPNELNRYSVSYNPDPENPSKEKATTIKLQAVDCIAFGRVSVDRQERYLWATSETGTFTVDVFDLDYFRIPLRVLLPGDLREPSLHWHSAEARRIFYWGKTTKRMRVLEMPAFDPPVYWKIERVFHEAFLEKRYERLDGLTAELAKDMRAVPGGTQLPVLCEVIRSFSLLQFQVSPSEWEARLRMWVDERPKSPLARLVFGMLLIESANRMRGNLSDDEVSDELADVISKNVKLTEQLLEPLLKSPTPWAETLFLQSRIGELSGWDQNKMLELSKRMVKIAPEHYEFFCYTGSEFVPPRGGKRGDAERYTKTIADLIPGESGDILYARMVLRYKNYFVAEDYFSETSFDFPRATRGLIAEWKKHPDDPRTTIRASDWFGFGELGNEKLVNDMNREDYESINRAYHLLSRDATYNSYMISK